MIQDPPMSSPSVDDEAELDRHLAAEAGEATQRWPDVPWDRAGLRRAIAGRLEPGESVAVAASWQLAELNLALACLAGQPAALARFDRLLEEVAVPAIASRGLGRAEIDEVVQRSRVRLLVGGSEAGPGLALYSGRGRLAGFVRSAAVRAALNLRRDQGRRDLHAMDVLLDAASHDPELRHMKEHYLEEFRRALSAAWDLLTAEEQLFVRHQLEDSLTIDDLARLYAIHRSTAARRLAAARDRLAVETRRRLRQDLGMSDGELDSVLRLIRSRLGDAADALG
jgi:RNA polymerase sigma-70 factor, ECF subfamily